MKNWMCWEIFGKIFSTFNCCDIGCVEQDWRKFGLQSPIQLQQQELFSLMAQTVRDIRNEKNYMRFYLMYPESFCNYSISTNIHSSTVDQSLMPLVNLNFTQHDRASLRLTIWVMKFSSFVLCYDLLFRHVIWETLSAATKATQKQNDTLSTGKFSLQI